MSNESEFHAQTVRVGRSGVAQKHEKHFCNLLGTIDLWIGLFWFIGVGKESHDLLSDKFSCAIISYTCIHPAKEYYLYKPVI